MKTILFWICEELPLSLWKPENLISCYMRCFRRLIYCAEYACCPHYFIPENNLFGNKIHGKAQKLLLNRLYILNSYGWQCILLSDQISKLYAVPSDSSMETSYSYPKSVQRLLNSDMLILETATNPFKFLIERVIYKVLLGKSSTIKYIYAYYMSIFCGQSDRYVPLGDISCNTSTYKEYNTYISALLLYTRHDATSGWLMLSTFFYKRKQYHTALHNIQYSVLKCTPEKLYYSMQLSDIHNALLNLHVFRNMPIVQLWKFLLVGFICIRKSELQPDELQTVERNRFPPIVYAHFLRFLCHYHLKNSRQCLDSLKELQFTIEGNYFTSGDVFKGISYNILGIGFQLLGYREAARQSFIQSIELFPNEKHNSAFRKLSLLN
ncbi:uncharacterized protein LOC143042796 [Mytilus galloprovincialis]|uniref:uncharacterized protein LOC143042796 n=1 Tax=Mytilus galloprovincialis TaxID=29158 RepID=UPI003F7C8B1A